MLVLATFEGVGMPLEVGRRPLTPGVLDDSGSSSIGAGNITLAASSLSVRGRVNLLVIC